MTLLAKGKWGRLDIYVVLFHLFTILILNDVHKRSGVVSSKPWAWIWWWNLLCEWCLNVMVWHWKVVPTIQTLQLLSHRQSKVGGILLLKSLYNNVSAWLTFYSEILGFQRPKTFHVSQLSKRRQISGDYSLCDLIVLLQWFALIRASLEETYFTGITVLKPCGF